MTRVACIECGAVTPIRERGICRRCEPAPFAPAEWIGPIFAAMPDAPEHLRGELEKAVASAEGRCADCGIETSPGSVRCLPCANRRRRIDATKRG